ncbi:MAG: hypothetical protein EPN23_06410 [Verrucomicrobia bacterium]|nr:MAG: hypothetical protein EPN23_06410 [Verrucomicrobiota bacterium]
MSWERWAHSRATKGNLWFGRGHSWRHSYQWEITSAGVDTNGAAKLQINYPDGTVYTFIQLSETEWESPIACPDILGQAGDDFLLQRANGWPYHIVRHYTTQGAAYYLLEDFTDAQGNIYTLTYNTARQLTKITEPAGRWLTIQYGKVTMNQGVSNTLVNISVITKVTASDGRQVAYAYAPYTDVTLPYTYQVLSSVVYPEGVQAHYEYTLARPGTRPLVARWDDPHYRLPLPRSRTEYSTDTNAAWGAVLRQYNDQTGEVLMEVGKYNGSVNIDLAP